MKKRILISACVLAACLVACTNDDFMSEVSGNANAVNENGVVGADLAGHGMTLTVSGEGADTRAFNGGWEMADKLGLAWYNIEKGGIAASQTETTWEGTREADSKIYANHLFTYKGEGTFTTQSDVYQGAYFVYFPFKSQASASGVQPKYIEVNGDEQTGNFEWERFNKSLHLSAQDFIAAGTGTDANDDASFQLTHNFHLEPAVNVLRVNATPEGFDAEETENTKFLKNLNVTRLTINARGSSNTNEIFADKAQLVPRNIPDVIMDKDNPEEIDVDATRAALDNAAANAMSENNSYLYFPADASCKKSSSVTTNIRNNYTLANLAEKDAEEKYTNAIRVFAFPFPNTVTYGVNDEKPSLEIAVGKEYTIDNEQEWIELGVFTLNDEDLTGDNKLEGIFDGSSAADLTKILRKGDEWSFVNLYPTLSVEDFHPVTKNIRSVDQWNDLVTIYDALYELGAVEEGTTVEFSLGADIDFDEIKTPEHINIKLVTNENTSANGGSAWTMGLVGENMTWPEKLLTDNNAKIKVSKETTLNIGMDGTNIDLMAVVINNGIIKAGKNVKINNKNGQNINNNGRIVIEYGAKIYPNVETGGKEGTIAYEVTDAENEPFRIFNLVDGENNNKGYANVNTLIVNEGITLDLDDTYTQSAADDEDPYIGNENPETSVMPNMAENNVTIELNGGDLKASTPENVNVAAVVAKEGESSMTDIKTPTITVEENATLDVKSATTPGKTDLEDVKKVTNFGTLNFNVNGEIEKVDNYGYIHVISPWTVTYNSLEQRNPATGDQGRADGNFVPAYRPNPQKLASAANEVKNAWNTLSKNNAYLNISSLEELASKIKQYAGQTAAQTDAFMAALNKWYKEYYGPTYPEITKAEINAGVLEFFETESDYEFFTE